MAGTGVFAEEILVSWEPNGVLVATGMEPGSTCTVERASNLSSPFLDVTLGLVGSGVTRAEVSLDQESSFFRVRVDAPPEVIPAGMVLIPAGTNSGTNPLSDGEVYYQYYPKNYSLTVTNAFCMDATEVTKAQWDEVYNWGVSHGYSFGYGISGNASNHPVHKVNWYNCAKWCNARSQMEGKTPCYTVDGNVYKATGTSAPTCDFTVNGYRLPTSEEWEYAARGGLQGKRFPWGDTITHSEANYYSSSTYSYDTSLTRGYYNAAGFRTSAAGSFPPNGYGLYDMSGNVKEWCNTKQGSGRSFRGGSWYGHERNARCGYCPWFNSGYSNTDLGFRAVCR